MLGYYIGNESVYQHGRVNKLVQVFGSGNVYFLTLSASERLDAWRFPSSKVAMFYDDLYLASLRRANDKSGHSIY